jgi:hypothetical protein
MIRFGDIIHLNTDRIADPLTAGIERVICAESGLPDFHALRQGLRSVPTTVAKVASLADIGANEGNLSIPLYVRGRAISDEKGEYTTNGLKEAVRAWEESS